MTSYQESKDILVFVVIYNLMSNTRITQTKTWSVTIGGKSTIPKHAINTQVISYNFLKNVNALIALFKSTYILRKKKLTDENCVREIAEWITTNQRSKTIKKKW